MILFGGIPSEPPLRYAIDAADAAGVDYVVFNQRQSHHTDLALRLQDGRLAGALHIGGASHPMEAFSGVYLRLMEACHLPENRSARYYQPDPELVEKSRLLNESLLEWAELADCRVFNRLGASASNGSKPYQAQIIAACGFAVPPTLITNDPSELDAFLAQHGRVVFKSISSVRSIVKELRRADVARRAKVRVLPTQFQAFIPGTNVRVHVVDERVFATEVKTAAVDYRYAADDKTPVSMSATKLPSDVADRCRHLSQRLNLPLCGIDLKRTPEGDYYCFEVNPSPAYSCYPSQARPIARAIVQALANAEGRSRHRRGGTARDEDRAVGLTTDGSPRRKLV